MGLITLVHDCDIERRDSPTAPNGDFRDTHLEEEYPDTNFDSNYAHYAGITGAGGKGAAWKSHAIYLYDLNAFIPASATITAAVWWFYVQFANTDAGHAFTVHRLVGDPLVGIPQDWFENEATWNDAKTGVPWDTPGGGCANPAVLLGNITTTGWKNYNILAIVSDAWSNRDGICHLILRRTDGGTDHGYISIASKSQHPVNPVYPHHLRVTYTLDSKTFQVMLR